MKNFTIVVLVLLGIYWLVVHAEPMPFSHEYFGLYNHMAHRIVGVVFLVAAFFVWKRR